MSRYCASMYESDKRIPVLMDWQRIPCESDCVIGSKCVSDYVIVRVGLMICLGVMALVGLIV